MESAAGKPPSLPLFLLLCLILANGSIGGQSTSSITGVIRDSSDAVIPGAEVTTTSLAIGSVRQTVTGEAGIYRVTNLLPGAYTDSASMAGFKTTVGEVEVTVGSPALGTGPVPGCDRLCFPRRTDGVASR